VDLIVALTHMRMQNDINLGSQVPEIDIILGHHDHHYEVTPSDPHGTLVGKSGTDYRELRLLKIALGGYECEARFPTTYSSSSACVFLCHL
jgi:5'-nucleotidase